MRTAARVVLGLGLAATAPACQAFVTTCTTSTRCASSPATSSQHDPVRPVRSNAQFTLSRSSGSSSALRPLCGLPSRPGVGEGGPAGGPMPVDGPVPKDGPEVGGVELKAKTPSELMDAASDADYRAPAAAAVESGNGGGGGVMGPARQPEEDKRKQRESFELNKEKGNKWASGAFKRGVALQAVVLSFVIFLSFQPEEVGNLAICAPFSKGGGCVGFAEWVEIVFFKAPIPPM